MKRSELVQRVKRESGGRCFADCGRSERKITAHIECEIGWNFGGIHGLVNEWWAGTGKAEDLYDEAYRDFRANLPALQGCPADCDCREDEKPND